MKKIIITIILLLIGILCLAPLPRKVNCQEDGGQVEGWYLDFLILQDKFQGSVVLEGNTFQPMDGHGAYKETNFDSPFYVISVYRYRAESNDVDMRTVYLEDNLRDLKEWK